MNKYCLDDKSLEALLGTSLDHQDRFRLESHLGECPDCQKRLLDLSGSIELVPPLPDHEPESIEQPTDEFLESLKQMVARETTIDMPVIRTGEEARPSTSTLEIRPEIPGLKIQELIGRGGMGSVYKAVQLGIDREVAVKVIPLGEDQAEIREHALRGASILASMNHPNIVRLFHVGQTPDFLYGVLEFVPGGDLKTALRRGPWGVRRAVAFMERLARVVGHLHENSVIHGDLKPGNVLLSDSKTPVLADFGIARYVKPAGESSRPASLGGTLCYMAPEQFCECEDKVSPATDVHALGIILHELLTGRTPFDVRPRSLVPDRIRKLEPHAPSAMRADVPSSVDEICLKCLRKDPSDRFSSAIELADQMRTLMGGSSRPS